MRRTLLVILLLSNTLRASAQTYTNLVMKGGGIRGIAYCGALDVLEQKHISQGIGRVAGTSVGAIVGVLFSVGYTSQEIKDIMQHLKIQTFNDGEWFFIGGQKRMRKNYGWYKGNKLEDWLGELIQQKTGSENITFAQLHALHLKDPKYKDLYVTATDLTLQRTVVFNYITYPDLPVKVAVRASASVPLYYGAVFIDSAGHYASKPTKDTNSYHVFADGGLLANYPITIFNEPGDSGRINPHTLGLKLDRPEQIAYYPTNAGLAAYNIMGFKNYLGALYTLTIEHLNQSLPYAVEKKNTIYISNGNMSPRVRHISAEQKDELYENGRVATEQFFKGQ